LLVGQAENDVGLYSVEVSVYDRYYNSRSIIVIVDVTESNAPHWLLIPEDQTSEFGSTFSYELKAEDVSGLDIWWLGNTTSFLINEQGVISNSTFLQVGEYTLTVWVSDTLGNSVSQTLNVQVVDSTAPIWITPPINQGLEYRDSLEMQVTAWDLSGIALWTVNNTEQFSISDTGLVTNNVLLDVGTYYLEVGAFDPFGNLRNSTITIIVRTLSPEALSIPMTFTIVIAFTGGVVFLLFTIIYVIRRPRVTNATTAHSIKIRSGT